MKSFALIVVLAAGFQGTYGVCEEGWTQFGCSCYYVEETSKTFDAARTSCQAKGADLAIVTDSEETQFVEGLLSGTDRAYIGLIDPTHTRDWVWVNGDEATYFNWYPGEPNNYQGKGEYCVIMRMALDAQWNDYECDKEVEKSICEKEATCEEGWSMYNCHCYYAEPTATSYSDARLACLQKDSDLVIVTDQEEQLFVEGLLSGSERAYIGLSDPNQDRTWYWVDGQLATYFNWYPGEPNNYQGKGEYCVIMRMALDAQWNDYECDKVVEKSICEKEI